jgi:LPS sulfotransferase NodH
MIDQHNSAWRRWFSSAGIEPFEVLYEELAADPAGITHRILDWVSTCLQGGNCAVLAAVKIVDRWRPYDVHFDPLSSKASSGAVNTPVQ